jgi:hypothetical protein
MAEDEVIYIFSDIFGVPAEWFKGPMFMINLILPMICLSALYYIVITNKVRMFRTNPIARWLIAITLSFFSIPVIVISPPFIIAACIASTIIFTGYRISLMRVFFSFAFGIGAWIGVNIMTCLALGGGLTCVPEFIARFFVV